LKWNRKRLHNGTVNLTIKNIPEEVYKTLKRTAAEHGRSLNAEAIQALSNAAEEAERRRRMRESRADLERFVATLPKLRRSSAYLIREDRDRR
jgi:plasmid stability protein